MKELLNNNVNVNDIDKFKNNYKKCKVVTCIHCVADICTNETCEMYERLLIQEG
ncbi:hypothetical protein [Tepidibacter thalassicus]|uniref:Uncharacterized protein n=1 Tax=Tepidibacter thalassicus DSM 15285 TaxID=1123350 RepID=A0A1M5PFC3_9FIRM|nr:hypothetical protein [Tepidibacter thalassicus]SHH00189.1 hypothetical protein SAMN02744040_00440 [Tepidibacter thalassicus DSM 15285]